MLRHEDHLPDEDRKQACWVRTSPGTSALCCTAGQNVTFLYLCQGTSTFSKKVLVLYKECSILCLSSISKEAHGERVNLIASRIPGKISECFRKQMCS